MTHSDKIAADEPISAIVADDHPVMLAAVCDVLADAGISVVGRATDGQEALAKIETRRPTVALVDVRMPRLSGVELAREVASRVPETSLVFYTAYGDRALVTEALDLGVCGLVLKEAPLQDLVRAIKLVAAGDVYVDPVLVGVLASATVAKLPSLTQRERDVLRLLADGRSNEEIGKRLLISAETVRTHLRKAMEKLEADTRTQAVATALRQSLIS